MAKDIDKTRPPFEGERAFAFSGVKRSLTEGATDDLAQRIMDMVSEMLEAFRSEIYELIENPEPSPEVDPVLQYPVITPRKRVIPPSRTTTSHTTTSTTSTTTHTTTTTTTTSTTTTSHTTTSTTTPERVCCPPDPVCLFDWGETYDFMCGHFSPEEEWCYDLSYPDNYCRMVFVEYDSENDCYVYRTSEENCPEPE